MFKKKSPPPTNERQRTVRTDRSAPVFSYYANRSPRSGTSNRSIPNADSSEASATRRRARKPLSLRRALHIAVLVCVAALLVGSLLLSNRPTIVLIKGKDPAAQTFLRSERDYTRAAQAILGGSFLNSNKLTFDAQGVSEQLQRQFPELSAVTIALPVIGRQPIVYMRPASPKLVLVAASGTYVLDTAGRALLTGNQVVQMDQLGLPVVHDQSGLSIQVQDIALPSNDVAFITEVAGQLKAKSIGISNLTLPSGTSELTMQVSGQAYTVKFNLHGNAREEVGAFLATKQYLESQGKVPAEYVDVRVNNRVYYK